jgi:hypothetical protein
MSLGLGRDAILDRLPRRASLDLLPPAVGSCVSMSMEGYGRRCVPSDVRVLGLVLEVRELLRRQEDAVRKVEEVREGDLVAGEVLVLGQDRLVAGHLALERLRELGHELLVRRLAEHRREDALVRDRGREDVEVGDLDRRGLLEERGLVRVGRRDEGGLGLRGDVAGDGARLIDDEAVVILRQTSAIITREMHGGDARGTGPDQTAAWRGTRAPCARPS